jgi:hypothetical protein
MPRGRPRRAKSSKATGQSAQPRKPTPGYKAEHPGTCPACQVGYRAGTPIRKVDMGWVHVRCAEILAERQRILDGKTFAAHKPSGYRIGESPSHSRSRY